MLNLFSQESMDTSPVQPHPPQPHPQEDEKDGEEDMEEEESDQPVGILPHPRVRPPVPQPTWPGRAGPQPLPHPPGAYPFPGQHRIPQQVILTKYGRPQAGEIFFTEFRGRRGSQAGGSRGSYEIWRPTAIEQICN